MYKKIILICGMPRSGTSWFGQIFDSSSDVAFRMEPLFAYKFKNIIDENSTEEEIISFFNDVYLTEDDFINQKENRNAGVYDVFKKNQTQEFLVVKTTRHHNLLKRYLDLIDCIEVISIVRHPCAVINSWINTDREFKSKGCTVENDWKSGYCRKDGIGEFWGFSDWLSVTRQHIELSKKYQNFNIVEYANLIKDPEVVIKYLFNKMSILYTRQTASFLESCHNKHHDDPYSVYKNKEVESAWKDTLNCKIAEEIIKKTIDSGMDQFVK